MLTTFKPGEKITWLGNMQKLGPAAELETNPYQPIDNEEAETSPFPVMRSQRRSYNSQANLVWIKPSGLQVQFYIVSEQLKSELNAKHSPLKSCCTLHNITNVIVATCNLGNICLYSEGCL